MGLKTHLALEVQNPPKTAGCVCFVTFIPTVAKPLALGMSLLCSGEGTPYFYGGSEGAHLASAAPSLGRGQSKGKGQEMGLLGSFQAPYSNSWEVKPVWKERREGGGKLALIFVRTKCWELPAVLFLFFVFVGGGG